MIDFTETPVKEAPSQRRRRRKSKKKVQFSTREILDDKENTVRVETITPLKKNVPTPTGRRLVRRLARASTGLFGTRAAPAPEPREAGGLGRLRLRLLFDLICVQLASLGGADQLDELGLLLRGVQRAPRRGRRFRGGRLGRRRLPAARVGRGRVRRARRRRRGPRRVGRGAPLGPWRARRRARSDGVAARIKRRPRRERRRRVRPRPRRHPRRYPASVGSMMMT